MAQKIISLAEIKKLGPKSRETLCSHFASEEDIIEIINNGNLHRIASLNNIPPKIISDIFRFCYENSFGFLFCDTLKTKKAKDTLNEIMESMKSFCSTQYGRYDLQRFMPTTNKSEIMRRLAECSEGAEITQKLRQNNKITEIRNLLKKIEEIDYEVHLKYNNIVITTCDEDIYQMMLAKIKNRVKLQLLQTTYDVEDIKHYESIRHIRSENFEIESLIDELKNAVVFEPTSKIHEILPEIIVDYFRQNINSINALIALNSVIPFSEEMVLLADTVKAISSATNSNKDGCVNKIRDMFADACLKVNNAIRESAEKASFDGKSLFGMLKNKHEINYVDIVGQDSAGEIKKNAESLLETIRQEYPTHDKLYFDDMFSINGMSLFIDEESLSRFIKSHIEHINSEQFKKHKALSESLKPHIENLPCIVQKALSVDAKIAVGTFILNSSLNAYTLGESILIKQGRNLMLKGNPQLIDYELGSTRRLSIITGANSGGKTTLLELILQMSIMSQMGIFVPAKASNMPIFDEIYYFEKNTGTLGIGAFEKLLQDFSAITENKDLRKLVLADEIESVTEPGAAAKIIEGIVEYFAANENTMMCLVTHLGEQLEHTSLLETARFDGIEAEGLNENNELIVNHNPVLGRIAQSTPQLIIKRLSKIHNNAFYNHISSKFCNVQETI